MDTIAAPDAGGFPDLGLRDELLDELVALGYEEPTPIQRAAIPVLLAGRDLLAQAATGTGKTAAFALPALERLATASAGGPRSPAPSVLVLVPTRELAVQVSQAFHRYGRALGARVLPIYGGQPIYRQLRALQDGTDVVVATPGRALDHLRRETLVLDDLRLVVLDEADEMLDMGFAEDIEAILESAPTARQTVLFSATMPARITGIARRVLHDPLTIQLDREAPAPGEAPKVRQVAYVVPRAHKPTALGRVLDVEAPNAAIVFCRTRTEVDQLTETLNGRGYRAEALHGGMDQEQRDRVMGRLRSGVTELLVATDVAARGLDVEQLTHVVNYDVPSAPEAYVHRIGRVGRAGREGVAITLAEPREHRLLKNIERLTGQRIHAEKVPSVADLRARQLELTAAAIREVILDGDLDGMRAVVEALSDEFDVVEVALGAVKLAHRSTTGEDEDDEEIPEVAFRPRSDDRPDRPARDSRARPGTDRGGRPPRGPEEGMTRLYVGVGRAAGVRPQDLVGAIAGESGISGRQIGAIQVSERFSIVEVPDAVAEDVIRSMRGRTIRGRKITVRRWQDATR
jgi:ATP-dependent RNA helicase DeaD